MPPTFAELAQETLRSELQDKMTELEGLLLSLEDGLKAERPPIEIIHLTLRHAHSLKSILSMAEKVVAAQAVHAMESAFVSVRAGHLPLSRPFFDLAFAMVDQLTVLVREDREDVAALEALFGKWQALVPEDRLAPPKPLPGLPFPLSANELERLSGVFAGTQFLYLVEKTVMSDCSREDFENLSILSDIASFGRLIAQRPSFETMDRSYRESVLLLLMATELPLSGVMERIYDPTRQVELSEADKAGCLAEKTKVEGRVKALVVEDDFISRLLLQKMLAPYGEAHMAVDGEEALVAIQLALEAGEPYDLICLDIMMPKLDGQATLKGLRQREENHGLPIGTGSKVVMTTALKDSRNVMQAFREQCDAYLVKPVDRNKLVEQLKRLGVLPA